MHQIRFRLRLRPRPRWGSSQRSPDLAGFKGREGRNDEREGKGRGEKGEDLLLRQGGREGERREKKGGES